MDTAKPGSIGCPRCESDRVEVESRSVQPFRCLDCWHRWAVEEPREFGGDLEFKDGKVVRLWLSTRRRK